jgi:hypothetical protein
MRAGQTTSSRQNCRIALLSPADWGFFAVGHAIRGRQRCNGIDPVRWTRECNSATGARYGRNALQNNYDRHATVRDGTVHPAEDPRILEVKVGLIGALRAQQKADESKSLSAEVEPLLAASSTPYAMELRTRLAEH